MTNFVDEDIGRPFANGLADARSLEDVLQRLREVEPTEPFSPAAW